jgi:hypothetical protein
LSFAQKISAKFNERPPKLPLNLTEFSMYYCKYCNQEFDNRYKMTGHSVHCSANPDVSRVFTCEFCNESIVGKHSYTQHLNHCPANPNKQLYKSPVRNGQIDCERPCQFCGKVCKNDNSLRNHERLCAKNPNKSSFKSNLKNRGWSKGLTKETDTRIAKQSVSLKAFYAEHPEAITGGLQVGTAKRCKYGTYKNFYCDSSWELAFIVYHLDHNISFSRNETAFSYELAGKTHNYYPDFIVGDTYYEIKGICSEKDLAKFKAFPKNLNFIVLDKKAMRPYLKYVEQKYGKDFAQKLYDRAFPCWLDATTNVGHNFKLPLDI